MLLSQLAAPIICKCKNTLHEAAPPPVFWCDADGRTRYCRVLSREPVKSEQIAEERKCGGGSERDCTYCGGGGAKLYCPGGFQALPACPDKNSIKVDASMERWWNDDRGKRKYLKRNWYQCHFVHHISHVVWPRKF